MLIEVDIGPAGDKLYGEIFGSHFVNNLRAKAVIEFKCSVKGRLIKPSFIVHSFLVAWSLSKLATPYVGLSGTTAAITTYGNGGSGKWGMEIAISSLVRL
jgi:hypothetical protein